MTRRLILALAPAAALAFATMAQAQPAGPPQPTAEMKARHEAMRTQHIEDLKTVLRLRPDQEPALKAFLEAHKPPPMAELNDGPPPPRALTTPQRLTEMGKRDAAMDAQRQRMRDALTRFYAALSPEQQKVFDALQRLDGPRGGPGGPDGPGMHGARGDGPRRMVHERGGPDGPDGGPPPGREPPR